MITSHVVWSTSLILEMIKITAWKFPDNWIKFVFIKSSSNYISSVIDSFLDEAVYECLSRRADSGCRKPNFTIFFLYIKMNGYSRMWYNLFNQIRALALRS